MGGGAGGRGCHSVNASHRLCVTWLCVGGGEGSCALEGVIKEVAAQQCGGEQFLENAVRRGDVRIGRTGNTSMYFSSAQRWKGPACVELYGGFAPQGQLPRILPCLGGLHFVYGVGSWRGKHRGAYPAGRRGRRCGAGCIMILPILCTSCLPSFPPPRVAPCVREVRVWGRLYFQGLPFPSLFHSPLPSPTVAPCVRVVRVWGRLQFHGPPPFPHPHNDLRGKRCRDQDKAISHQPLPPPRSRAGSCVREVTGPGPVAFPRSPIPSPPKWPSGTYMEGQGQSIVSFAASSPPGGSLCETSTGPGPVALLSPPIPSHPT